MCCRAKGGSMHLKNLEVRIKYRYKIDRGTTLGRDSRSRRLSVGRRVFVRPKAFDITLSKKKKSV